VIVGLARPAGRWPRISPAAASASPSSKAARVNTRTAFNTHAMPFDFPNRQVPTMRPGWRGSIRRAAAAGGKTMLWNAVALRFSQRDFKGRNTTVRRGLADRLCRPGALLRSD
jgi:hypothetical protein